MIRRSIAEIEFERATLAEMCEALDAYRDLVGNRVVALSAMLGKLRSKARSYELQAEHREPPALRRAA